MLQYLLNTTAIWLMSLILFDVFLRRESYHAYNRLYLLFTFLLGAFVPLWQWQNNNPLHTTSLQQPVERVIAVKQSIVTSAPSFAIGWEQVLMIIYYAGAFIALCILIMDIIKLTAFSRNGMKSAEGDWTIIETGKDHAPFSFMHTLFICSRQQYSHDEWNMIQMHEQQHTSLMHFTDLMLMQVSRIIFWFHPLVYIYNKRILLVHEYQADHASAKQPQVYGKFLVEQALLQSAPSLSNSFNRSPIKKRIIMLTRRSTTVSKIKMFVFIPLALVCTICFSKNGFSQKFVRNGNIVTYRGNTFEYSEAAKPDTQILTDPVTGTETIKVIKRDPVIIKMNGKDIPQGTDKEPYYTGNGKSLRDYLLQGLKNELCKLDDGQYTLNINNILIDEHGKIVYFEYQDMRRSRTSDEIPKDAPKQNPEVVTTNPSTNITVNLGGGQTMALRKNTNPAYFEEIDKNMQQEIFNKVCDLVEIAPGFIPAMLNGEKVVGTYFTPYFWNHFKIQNHKLYDVGKNGEFKEL